MFVHYSLDNTGNIIFMEGYDSLVIGGGGLKGSQFLGALQYLEEQEYLMPMKYFFGTSVGSIICLLLILGYSPENQYNLMKDKKIFSFKHFKKITATSLLTFELPIILQEIIDPNMTFQQLYEITEKHLHIIAYNCTKKIEVIFGLSTTPEKSVFEAICCGCTLPFAFELPQDKDGDFYMDGGIINNLCVDVAANYAFSKRILALRIVDVNKSFQKNSYVDILNILINIPSQKLDDLRLQLVKPHKVDCITCMSDHGVSGILLMSKHDKDALFEEGYEAARKFFLNDKLLFKE
jgi:predicted acylesterase/phospholipase RssA